MGTRTAGAVMLLAACGRIGFGEQTGLFATIDGELDITSADARLEFSALDPNVLHALPAQLPIEHVFALPDAEGPLRLVVSVVDRRGRRIEAEGTTQISRGANTLAIALSLPAGCDDGVRNGDEAGVDCGGGCPLCPVGETCTAGTDCATGVCAGTCEPASSRWNTLASFPSPLLRMGAGLGSDGRIYVFGGSPADAELTDVTFIYDSEANSWSAGPRLPSARTGLGGGIATAAGTLLAIGGISVAPLTTFERLVPGGTWTAAPAMPVARSTHGVVIDGAGIVYALGGQTTTMFDDATMHAFDGTSWSVRASMPLARTNFVAVFDGTHVLAIGGHNGANSVYFDDVSAYDPALDQWSARPALPRRRSDLAAVLAPDGRVYAIGGFGGVDRLAEVTMLRPGGVWIDGPSLLQPRDAGVGVVARDGRIIAIGGKSMLGANGTMTAEAYGPRLLLAATRGRRGDPIAATGSSFAANATVRISFDGIPIALAQTDALGSFATSSIVIPFGADTGRHAVRAIDDRAGYPSTADLLVE